MKIFTLYDPPPRRDFERLRRKRKSGWQLLMSGWRAAGPISETRCSVSFSHSPDRTVWAILEAASRKRVVAVCETDPAIRTEEALAAMLRQLDADTGTTFELVDDERGAVDFDELWRLYTGASPVRQPSICEAPPEDDPSTGRTDNVVPFRKLPPGEKFDLEEVRRIYGFVQWKRANWKAMQEASERQRAAKPKRKKKAEPRK